MTPRACLIVPAHRPGPSARPISPAHQPERIAKALANGADTVIVDREDAVPPQAKAAARAALAQSLKR